MTEEMSRFAEILVIVQKYFRLSPAIVQIINIQPDMEHMTSYLQCALCGISENDIIQMSEEKLEVYDISSRRTFLLTQMYRENDEMYKTVEQANAMAKELTAKNEAIREMFEHDVKAAIQKEREANERALNQMEENLQAKNTEIQMIKSRYMTLLEENESMQQSVNNCRKRISELEKTAQNIEKPTGTAANGEDRANRFEIFIRQGRRIRRRHKQSYAYKLFTKNIIRNNAYSDGQKKYLTECMADGMPYSIIKKIAAPNITVDMMEQLRRYYEDNII